MKLSYYTCNSRVMSMALGCQETISLGYIGVASVTTSLASIQPAPGFPEHEFLSFFLCRKSLVLEFK